MQNNSNINKKL